jgi:hypothetical protein
MRNVLAVAACLCATVSSSSSYGQATHLSLKQDRDGAVTTSLTGAELTALGDPLFNLVLKDKANLIKLSDVEAAIQPIAGNRRLFVVDERIVRRAQTAPNSRRTVITFSGSNGGETLDGNVMLSTFLSPSGIADSTDIEAWGWDNARQRYNYYKLDNFGAPAGSRVWKFRVSSVRAEQVTRAERAGTCLACHVVGAPVMKELFFPWNNWHAGVGTSFPATYLDPNSLAPDKWPAASTPPFRQLTQANVLEDDILIPAFKRFSLTRMNSAIKRDAAGNRVVNAAGKSTVTDGRRLLRPLFETTEVNLYSSHDKSGIHPFGPPADFMPTRNIRIPSEQFFLNTNLIAGDGEGSLGGLQLASGQGFTAFANLTQQENKDLVTKFAIKLNGVSGDSEFAWIVPGVSYGNNALLDQCLQLGVVTPHFLAAALAVDVENPAFSTPRASLLDFIPDQFDFTPVAAGVNPTTLPRDAANDLLTQAVIAKINAAGPATGSPADEFRTLLKSADAVQELDARVKAYVARVKTKLDTAPANATTRKSELERLFGIVIARRKAMEADPILRTLDETGGQLLLPLP